MSDQERREGGEATGNVSTGEVDLGAFRHGRARRGIAAGMVVLAMGGMVLFRTSASARAPGLGTGGTTLSFGGASPVTTTTFAGRGVHGSVALSHGRVLADRPGTVFADVRVVADARTPSDGLVRAPLSIAVVLDTSGSMSGDKLEQAKHAVLSLIQDMNDDDEVALVRYSDRAEVVQGLARVGEARRSLTRKVQALEADGGTSIPRGLAEGLRALREGENGGSRVRRVVLVSDGLDSTRAQAERLAEGSFEKGITVSSLGIGLDFDEGYMSGLSRVGHGNFGFVKDAGTLATFLHRELKETAGTTAENVTVHLDLPAGVRLAEPTEGVKVTGGGLDIKMGALFGGDERRVLVELAVDAADGETKALTGTAAWDRVGIFADVTTNHVDAALTPLVVVGTRDPQAVEAARDPSVLASAVSVRSSRRQLAATEAYVRGDTAKADALIQDNLNDLKAAAADAPAPVAQALEAQAFEYKATKAGFGQAAPSSVAGKEMAKKATERDVSNIGRRSY